MCTVTQTFFLILSLGLVLGYPQAEIADVDFQTEQVNPREQPSEEVIPEIFNIPPDKEVGDLLKNIPPPLRDQKPMASEKLLRPGRSYYYYYPWTYYYPRYRWSPYYNYYNYYWWW
ncbi:uncharacterized protein LOC129757537 [Uranotaenia lowii]|uniref:uncharacterized protein LOC129757537 n=1 Tax=Uranotaenia lowii TaxID=190385 RepID=UPI002478EEC9|nr:uncharacterized protein LOC129757537 [Uranotaenia lowii]